MQANRTSASETERAVTGLAWKIEKLKRCRVLIYYPPPKNDLGAIVALPNDISGFIPSVDSLQKIPDAVFLIKFMRPQAA
jgi:hypothetical protein